MHDPFDCRCPHAAFSPRLFAEAERAFGRRSFLTGAAAASLAMLLPWKARAASQSILLKSARLFDGMTMHTPGVLVIRDDRIVSMNAGDAGSDARIIELGDATLMPGMIDCHTHVAARVVPSLYFEAMMPKNTVADNVGEAAIYSIHNAQVILRNGFTTVRDVGGGAGIDLALRNAINNGAVVGPHIFAAGPALSITGGHGDTNDIPDWVHEDPSVGFGSVGYGPYGFREIVRQHVKNHVDHIKILATGGVLSYGDVWNVPQMNEDEIVAVVDESTKFGRKVCAHAHGDPGIAMAVNGGVQCIEHCTGVSDKTLEAMRQRGTHMTPTIWALDSILQPGNPDRIPQNSLEKAEAMRTLRNQGMQRTIAAGAKIAYGTDAGVFPHAQNNKDFALLASMGMHPIDLLRATTSVAAENIGLGDRGVLAPGKLADVVVFNGDPSRDIALLEKAPALVMLAGKKVGPNP
ncbi:MAG TPA: amidohydrolase family protein [Candidatus Baltobacteraceae bacterium]|nr:amidohydrolase family protein [Candidatus Baltobacteraceae bacterium]